jgi:hypothetical protein
MREMHKSKVKFRTDGNATNPRKLETGWKIISSLIK